MVLVKIISLIALSSLVFQFELASKFIYAHGSEFYPETEEAANHNPSFNIKNEQDDDNTREESIEEFTNMKNMDYQQGNWLAAPLFLTDIKMKLAMHNGITINSSNLGTLSNLQLCNTITNMTKYSPEIIVLPSDTNTVIILTAKL